jgi:pantoate--beta-alanine ligase
MSNTVPIVRIVHDLRRHVALWRGEGLRTALVPTMGALHAGHLSLIDAARARADRVAVSIFVNPKQFAANEDLETYPCDPAGDLARLAGAGTDLAYLPSAGEIYPEGFATSVAVSGLTDCLCGVSRPHFFGGVATVVAKLLIQAGADIAVFGEKDYQQLLVIRRMARDLDIPTEIVGAPTVREADGLAMSSRNAYLTPGQRQTAGAFARVLRETADAVGAGRDPHAVLARAHQELTSIGVDRIDYIDIRHAETLAPASDDPAAPRRIFAAIVIGTTRLIDNLAVPVP